MYVLGCRDITPNLEGSDELPWGLAARRRRYKRRKGWIANVATYTISLEGSSSASSAAAGRFPRRTLISGGLKQRCEVSMRFRGAP